MLIDVHPAGTAMPPADAAQIRQLFADEYFAYHYAEHLGATDRVRFAARISRALVGYASYVAAGRHAHLSNLLVRETHRGRGIGARLEQVRAEHATAHGLSMYVSCVCDDPSSQALKLNLGLRPIAVKLGYRRGVSDANAWGSAVVFSGDMASPTTPQREAIDVDPHRHRMRLICRGPIAPLLAKCDPERLNSWYVDVLVGPSDQRRLRRQDILSYAGFDLDLPVGTMHHCFQLRNSAFVNGLRREPVVVALPPGVCLPFPVRVGR